MSSKYKGKKRFNKATPVPARPPQEPVYKYISDCHDSEAVKPPCERSDADRAKRQWGKATLGTWKCTTCRRKCKVRRRKNKVEVEA